MRNIVFCTVCTDAGLTTIVTSEVDDRDVSLAVSRKTYVPATENAAVVLTALAFPNVTVLGPLTCDQVVSSVPFGKLTSVAVPERLALAGNVTVCPAPAF